MRALVARAGLAQRIAVASAGTGDWHVGAAPDARACAAAAAREFELTGVARQVSAEDWERFDRIVAMDHANLRTLWRLAPDEQARAKLSLLLGDADVPDPYGGERDEFDHVLDLVEQGCRDLLDEIGAKLASG